MSEKYIMLDVNDPKAQNVAEVLSNKTAKKILSLLAENELSESDIANKLGFPINTIDYNIKKLENAGLIEKTKQYFWSVKGKKIPLYKISNKKIVISPKSTFRGVIPTVLVSGAVALGLRYLLVSQQRVFVERSADLSGGAPSIASEALGAVANGSSQKTVDIVPDVFYALSGVGNEWIWFFLGAITALLIFLVWNWRRVW